MKGNRSWRDWELCRWRGCFKHTENRNKKATEEIKEGIQLRGKWKGSNTGTALRTEVQEKKDWKQRSIILVADTEKEREMQGSK